MPAAAKTAAPHKRSTAAGKAAARAAHATVGSTTAAPAKTGATKEARPDTREQILRVAGGLLLARGFSGFSYAHIAEALHVQTAAIHYHFPTKAALGTALVEKYRARYRRWMDEAADQGFSPVAELEGYFKIALRFADDGLKACPGGVLQAEFAAIPAPMQDEVTRMMGEIQRWLAGVLERGRAAGAFHFDGDAMAKGAVVMATVQGALQVARALGRPLLDSALAQTRRDLGISNP